MIPPYLQKTIKDAKLLSLEEEKNLAYKIKQDGCQKSLQKLIEGNYRLVVKIAMHFQNCGLLMEDLIQEGNLGLIKAAERFDVTRGYKFSTYATWWIKQSILLSLDEKGRTVRIPGWLLRFSDSIQSVRKKYVKETGKEPSLEQIADALNTDVEKVVLGLQTNQENLSFDFKVDDEEESFIDRFITSNSPNYEEDLFFEQKKQLLSQALKTLSERELSIIKQRFDLDDSGEELTLQVIGERLGVTNERIRQIEAKTLAKLKTKLTSMCSDF